MTAAREERRRLVGELPDDQVAVAVVEVRRLAAAEHATPRPPAWFGTVGSGRRDNSELVEDWLKDSAADSDRLRHGPLDPARRIDLRGGYMAVIITGNHP